MRLLSRFVFLLASCTVFNAVAAQEPVYQQRIRTATEKPVAVKHLSTTEVFYDYGKTYFGKLELKTEGIRRGDSVTLRLGEKLDASGRIDQKPGGNVRFHSFTFVQKEGMPASMYYPDQKNAKNTSGNAIRLPQRLGVITPFRYAEIETFGPSSVPEPLRDIFFYEFHDEASSFKSSDPILNSIWELCKHTIKATSFAGLYIDGDRERIPYEADALVNQLSHYAVDSVYDIAQHTIDHLMAHPTWPTEWHLQMHQVVWNDYLFSGDQSRIRKYYDLLRAKSLVSLASPNGLISTTSGKQTQSFLDSIHYVVFDRKENLKDITDWPQRGNNLAGPDYKGEADEFVFCPHNAVVNAYHYRSLVLMGKMAGLLNRKDDELFFKTRAVQVRKSFSQVFFDPSTGLVKDGDTTAHASFHANFFSLCFGLLSEKQKATVVPFIIGKGMACSVYASQFLLDALYENGYGNEGYNLLTSRDARSWYHMVAIGAGMTTEAWDTRFKPNQDWNHAWGAAPANVIAFRLMGLRPAEPGFRKLYIEPQPGKLSFASIKLPTPLGVVTEEITREGSRYLVTVRVPREMETEVLIPKKHRASFKVNIIKTNN